MGMGVSEIQCCFQCCQGEEGWGEAVEEWRGRGKRLLHGLLDGGVEARRGGGCVWMRGWEVAGSCVCVCVWEPSLPPSTVKSSGCQAYSRLLVLPLSLSVPPSLPWQCHFVSTHMLVCSRVGVVGLGGGDIGTWAASVFFLSPLTLDFLLVCRCWRCSL